MRPILLTFLAWLVAFSASAKLDGNGYYRVQNHKSKRYVYVMDNKGSLDFQSTSAEVGAIELWMGHDKSISDPASVIYVTTLDNSTVDYDFQTQGTGVYKMISHPVRIRVRNASEGIYGIYGSNSGLARYLGDGVKNTVSNQGYMSTTDTGEWTNWQFHQINSSTDEYFGLAPTVKVGSSWYQPFYADFPFTTASSGMEVYYISLVDDGMAVLRKIEGTVPRATPVLVKCSSDQPTSNRLNIGGSASAVSGNQLKGVYFENYDKLIHNNLTPYDKTTMRLLGLNSKGELAFVTGSVTNVPRNQAYLSVPASAPAELKVVTQQEYDTYQANKTYKLTYMLEGKEYKSYELKAGTAITPEQAPAKTGYTFNGWEGLPATMPAHAVTVTGDYTVNTYTVTYMVDGAVYTTVKVPYGSAIPAQSAPAKEGHTFTGWEGLPATMPANDITASATYSVNTYTATFTVDGVVYATVKVRYGDAIPAQTDPAKEGWTFLGWGNLPERMPAHDVSIYARFSLNSYTITYMFGEKVHWQATIDYGCAIPEVASPAYEGHSFAGWEGLPDRMPARDVVVYATYTVNSYKLTYNVDGSMYLSRTVEYGSAIEPEPDPVRKGYTFGGWQNVPEVMPAHDVTVDGEFTVNEYTLTYLVDGEVYSTCQVAYGSPITPEPAPLKEGYTFSGWSNLPDTMPAMDVTVSGIFHKDFYVLTYMVDGEVYRIFNVAPGTELTAEAAPVKEGYTFSGWEGLPDVMPENDVTVTGSFEINSYHLTIYLDGRIHYESMLEFGAPVEFPPLVFDEGQELDYWTEAIPETMPAHDLELHAHSKAGIDEITAGLADGPVDVYSTTGQLLLRDIPLSELGFRLAPGIYIVSGHKICIR